MWFKFPNDRLRSIFNEGSAQVCEWLCWKVFAYTVDVMWVTVAKLSLKSDCFIGWYKDVDSRKSHRMSSQKGNHVSDFGLIQLIDTSNSYFKFSYTVSANFHMSVISILNS